MVRGIMDTTWIDFPPNLDQNYIASLTNARGVSFATVLSEIESRLAAFAGSADPLIAALATFTTEAASDGTTTTVFDLEEETEYGLPRPELGEQRAHMLPFRRYAKALGFTEEGLWESTLPQITRQIDNMLNTFTRGRLLKVLLRLFDDADHYVDRNTTTVSPGFAGASTGDNAFTGTYPDGTALPGGYTHYYRDEVADIDVVLAAALARIERWHPFPYDLILSSAALDLLTAESLFVDAGSALVRPAQGDAEALVDSDRYVGVYNKKIRVWHSRLELGSTNHMALFKTYGDFDERNALAIRYDARFGRGVEVRYRSFFPLDQAVMRARFGVGVNDRTAAVLMLLDAAGGYVAPTIS